MIKVFFGHLASFEWSVIFCFSDFTARSVSARYGRGLTRSSQLTCDVRAPRRRWPRWKRRRKWRLVHASTIIAIPKWRCCIPRPVPRPCWPVSFPNCSRCSSRTTASTITRTITCSSSPDSIASPSTIQPTSCDRAPRNSLLLCRVPTLRALSSNVKRPRHLHCDCDNPHYPQFLLQSSRVLYWGKNLRRLKKKRIGIWIESDRILMSLFLKLKCLKKNSLVQHWLFFNADCDWNQHEKNVGSEIRLWKILQRTFLCYFRVWCFFFIIFKLVCIDGEFTCVRCIYIHDTLDFISIRGIYYVYCSIILANWITDRGFCKKISRG